MAEISVTVERPIGAPAEQVYGYLADYREHHPRILPAAFSEFRVEGGGVGAGTVFSMNLTAGGRTRAARAVVAEPEPGRVLTETITSAGMVTTFTVLPEGDGSRVRIDTVWQSRGLRGVVERLLVPRLLTPIYTEELALLDRYARERAEDAQPAQALGRAAPGSATPPCPPPRRGSTLPRAGSAPSAPEALRSEGKARRRSDARSSRRASAGVAGQGRELPVRHGHHHRPYRSGADEGVQ